MRSKKELQSDEQCPLFFPPHFYFRPLFLFPTVVQTRGPVVGSYLHYSTTVRRVYFYRQETEAVYSRADSRTCYKLWPGPISCWPATSKRNAVCPGVLPTYTLPAPPRAGTTSAVKSTTTRSSKQWPPLKGVNYHTSNTQNTNRNASFSLRQQTTDWSRRTSRSLANALPTVL